jgi:hypothetical protein
MQTLKQFRQGFYVGGCALMTMGTLGWMISDNFNFQKKQIINDYENKIKKLNDEISKLKTDRTKE